jgi:hypothetical protein
VTVEDFRPLIEVPIVKQLAGEGDMSSVQGTRGRLADLEARLGCTHGFCAQCCWPTTAMRQSAGGSTLWSPS